MQQELITALDKLLKHKHEDPSTFYTLLSDCKIDKDDETYFQEYFLPKIYYLYEDKILRRDLIYLSLLASENFNTLDRFIEFDKANYSLNVQDAASLFDYCVYKQKHWLYQIINDPESYIKQIPEDIYNKILLLKFIQVTNSLHFDTEDVYKFFNKLDQKQSDFWGFYLKQVDNFIDVSNFVKNFKPELETNEIIKFASKNSFLETISHFLDLNKENLWPQVLKKIETNGEIDQLNIFTGFTIISCIFRLLLENNSSKNTTILIEDIKDKVLNLKDGDLQLELLENIFSLIFDRNSMAEFVCREKEVRLLLFLLKTITDELTIKLSHFKEKQLNKRLSDFNIYLTDALWRLDLVTNVTQPSKREDRLLNYMLAPPESLIHLCLKADDFERAYQVIKISQMQDSDIAKDINYSEKLLKFRQLLKKNSKVKVPSKKPIEDFINKTPKTSNESQECPDKFMNLFDLALTQPQSQSDCMTMLHLAAKHLNPTSDSQSSCVKFYQQTVDLIEEIPDKTLSEILISPDLPTKVEDYGKKRDFRNKLAHMFDQFVEELTTVGEEGNLNRNHQAHKTILQINEICQNFANNTNQYLLRLLNYLRAFSRILYIEVNSSEIVSRGKNTSYFELLNYNRSELMGKLLFERQLDPTEFEKYFAKLKLDFLYHVVGNCFPTVNLHVQENVTIEELYHDNMLYIPSASIIVYIQKCNWLLAFILNEMYKVEGVKIDISEIRLKTFFNYLKLPKIQHLKALFENNDIVTALQNCISAQKVRLYLQEHIIKQDLVSITSQNSSNSNESCETGEEILEDIKTTDWKTLKKIIESIPESQLRKKLELIKSKDDILSNLVHDGFEENFHNFVYSISDRNLRNDTILNNMKKWSGQIAMLVIKCEITRFDCFEDGRLEFLRDWLKIIEINDKLKTLYEVKSWYKSYDFCKKETETAFRKLLDVHDVNLLLDFIQIYKPKEEILCTIQPNYLVKIMDQEAPLERIKILLDQLPFNHSINLCNSLLTILRKLEYLEFIADYLNHNISTDETLRNIKTSLKILSVFNTNEQESLFCLINEPVSILEVLLMNTQLDKLGSILELLHSTDNSIIKTDTIDQLLRLYAEKSLDFRVITQPRHVQTPEHKLLQSFDSESVLDRKEFIVPENVPSKEEWVANDEVSECMCCRQINFSMFNRRHHCRRCGRVVCYNCSLKRMLVPTYGDILVRVCTDCYTQTMGAPSDRSDPSLRSYTQYWLLNDDPDHNEIVRAEFSYEHAPSISLCLSILKYHSKNANYPKFLLEKSEMMLKLLHPGQEPTHEIDYLLVIKMLRSLAIAAKMHSGSSAQADRILSQADILTLLAARGCLSLMPVLGTHVDAATLRRLRDRLLQGEQWNLALEVSTKAGLDNTGVFAAWGKSCLKAGSLILARDKFQRCFDKNSHYETGSLSRFSETSRSTDSLRSRSTSTTSEQRPTKDPPLLHEILQILETKTTTLNITHYETPPVKISDSQLSLNRVQTDNALTILNKIRNLKVIASGNFNLVQESNFCTSGPKIDKVFYQECVYYLTRYGTYSSLLEFYVKHGDLYKALDSILENHLSVEYFIEMYIKCLKDGLVELLQENMSKIDSSLDVWKDYLKSLCRHLEAQNLINSLYQLQIYIGDYVRAAMTCIRFYQDNAKTFTELCSNTNFLKTTEEHLKQRLEQEQWVDISNDISKDSFEQKTIANPDLIMKIDSQDVEKHINTISSQIELVDFLTKCEQSGCKPVDVLKEIAPSTRQLPTLFGSMVDKINLVVLLIICGDIEEGFDLASRLIYQFKLRPIKVYCLAAKLLAQSELYNEITRLVNCIKVTGVNDAAISDMLDEVLTLAVGTLVKANVTGTKVEDLIKLIKDRGTKISAYIEAKQLKTAYFLAVKYKRTADIRRIQREAELLNMPSIKILCQKVLQGPNQ